MTSAAHPARTAISASAALVVATASASAQEGAVERCRAEPTVELQVACLEAAVAAFEDEDANETAAPAPPTPAALDAPPSEEQSATEEPQGLGAEQVVARMPPAQRPPEEVVEPETAHIVAHDTHGYAQLEVTLDNGQVWRQLQGDRTRVRLRGDEPIAVTIAPSRFGGYRMLISDPRREIQVERIR